MVVDFDSPVDTSTLKGRSVLVTGAASGIGLACATQMAELGALVTLADLQEEAGQTAAQQLLSKGCKAQFVKCDVTSYQNQVNVFEKAIQFGGGKIDVVIPIAGIVAEKNLFDMVDDAAPTLNSPPPREPPCSGLTVNLNAVYNTCYLAMHYFRLHRPASGAFQPNIVLMASLAGYVGYNASSSYSISKFGIRGLFYGIRDRAGSSPTLARVNLVAPWFIKTAMTTQEDFVKSEAGALLNMTGFAPMERVVDAVLRFAVDETLCGRAAGIFPAGNEDLGDDLAGFYGGQVLHKHMTVITQNIIKAMAAMQAPNTTAATQDGPNMPQSA